MSITSTFLDPPPALSTQYNPADGGTTYAFPLQTNSWLAMQTVIQQALLFPNTTTAFTNLYGAFSDADTVVQAVQILDQIQQTATQYGDPTTLISDLSAFQSATTMPDTIYGAAVWLAAQTVWTANQIVNLLNAGLTDIGTISDPTERLADLTALLQGPGSVSSYASTLQGYITAFEGPVQTFYNTMNAQIAGSTNSLEWYLTQDGNVLSVAQGDVSADTSEINALNEQISTLNKEYIGFTVAACVSPVFLGIPFVGVFLTVADATTFGVMAAEVKKQLDALNEQLASTELDYQEKSQLVAQLQAFDSTSSTVETDGVAFLAAISGLIGGWSEFASQIADNVAALTMSDVDDWPAFLVQVGFQAAVTNWQAIATQAQVFYGAGFVTFAPAT